MISKCIKFLGLFLILTLLTGCQGEVPYNARFFRANPDDCWPCQMYMKSFQAMDGVLNSSLDSVAHNSLLILEMALLFWLLAKTLNLLLSLKEPNIKKEFSSFVVIMFKAGIVAIFLNNTAYMYNFFGGFLIQTFGEGFVALAEKVLSAPTEMGISITPYNITDYVRNLLNVLLGQFGGSLPSPSVVSTQSMFGGISTPVNQIIFKIFAALWSGVGLGIQLWVLKGWSSFFAGLILITGMLWLMLMIPLSFVDAFVRIGLMLILLPLLMVGWVFSYPKNIVKVFFHNILAGFFDILFVCIYISFLITMLLKYEQNEIPGMLSSVYQTMERSQRTVANNFGTEFLILIVLIFSMIKLSSKIQDFSKYFFDTAGKSSFVDGLVGLKNLVTKGVRIGASILAGPAGWAKMAGDSALNVIKTASNLENNESNSSGEKEEGGDKKQDDSQKASGKHSAPSEKKGNK